MSKSKIDYKTSDFYKKAKKKLNLKITQTQYIKIINDFNELIQEEVLKSYYPTQLPHIGTLQIIGEVPKYRPKDAKNSIKYKRKILQFLDETEGYIFKIHFKFPYKISDLYDFYPVRKFSRTLLKSRKSNKIEYFKIN